MNGAITEPIPTHSHDITGGDTGESVTWTKWDGTTDLNQAGYYYLTKDVEVTKAIEVSADDVHLCLNGCTISGDSCDKVFSVTGKLTICDCEGGGTVSNSDSIYRAAVRVTSSGSLTLYGGTLNGDIGNGVFADGTNTKVTIAGGTVSGTRSGGALGVSGGTVTITGGQVNGVKLQNRAKLYLTGTPDVDAIMMAKSDTADGYNNQIIAAVDGQGYTGKLITITSDDKTIPGKTVIVQNVTNDNANRFALTNYELERSGNDLVVKADQATVVKEPQANKLTYNGQAQTLITAGEASGGTMVYSLTEDGEYTAELPTAINAGTYTVWYKVVGDETHTDSDVDSIQVTIDDVHSHNITGGDGGDAVTWTEWDGKTNLDQAGYYYLTNDVEVTKAIEVSADDVHLCLNGCTISGDSCDKVFSVTGKLTICDCEGGGTVSNSDSIYRAAVRVTSSGSLTLYGGTLNGGIGNGVFASGINTKVTIDGGTVSGARSGGALGVSGGTATITGGQVNGVKLQDRAKLYLAGTPDVNAIMMAKSAMANGYFNQIIAAVDDKAYTGNLITIASDDDKIPGNTTIVQNVNDGNANRFALTNYELEKIGDNLVVKADQATVYTLTYNANGGTFTAGTTFTVKGLEDTAAYQLGEETGYAAPTKGTDVFLGWTTDPSASGKVYGAGQQLPEVVTEVSIPETTIVYAVWGADSNGDGIADAQQIVITPADITVYTGGTGYDGVVDGAENHGIPEPGYYFTLPAALNDALKDQGEGYVDLSQYIRLNHEGENSRQWVLEFYDGTKNSEATQGYIYRLVEDSQDGTSGTPAKLVIKDSNGKPITTDKLDINDGALFQEYTMSLDDSAVKENEIVVEVLINGSWVNVNDQYGEGTVAGLILGEGTLTVRGTDNSTPTLTTDIGSDESDVTGNDQIANEESQTTITAVAPEGTDYTINGSDVTTGGSIGLLTDGLLPNDVLSGYLDEHNLTDENTKVDYQYLDLVDMSNGNAYVTADSALDIYWKLPADADVSGDFYVVHFNGLDRNYDVDQLDQLIGDANHAVTIYSEAKKNLDVVTINGEQYLKFATSSFSPFALVYDTKDEPVVEKVTVTFDSGKHGDFGWYHVTSKDVELTKGDKLAAYQIPYVFEDEGYEFIGWYKQGSGSWNLYSDEDLLEMTFTSDTTFIAQYKYVGGPSVDDEYDVVYNANFTDGGVPRRQGYDKGETVTVSENKWFERDGYIFVGWNTEADGTGDSYDPDDTFKMPGRDVYLYAQWQKEKPGPDDTGVSRWLETEDHNAYLTGYPDSTFGADRNMTRAEVAQMFYSLLKNKNVMITTSFSDVSNDAWYATAVKTMASLGMMSGYPDGTFRPDEPITRAEFATVALAFAYEPDNARCSYLDVSTSAWYYTYVAQATTYGWIGGYPDGTFRPNNSITRVEVCVIVNNMLGRTPDEDYIDRNEDELVNFVDLSDRYWGYYTIMEATNGHEYTGNYSNETWESVK